MPVHPPRSARLRRAALCLAVGLGLAAVQPTLTADYEAAEAELEELRARMDAVAERVAERERATSRAGEALREVEAAIGDARSRLRRLDAEVEAAEGRVADLRERLEAEHEGIEAQRALLAEEIRAAHASGGHEGLRLLLSAEDPAAADRLFGYLESIAEARRTRVARAREAIEAYREQERAVARELAELEALRERRTAERRELERRRSEREATRAEHQEALAGERERLAALEEEEAELEALVEDLRSELADISGLGEGREPFQERRGALDWPLEGQVLRGYGDEGDRGGESRGILIDGARGDPVEAVAHGRVVFSDWLRGLGLLLIIDHGEGHMTLYGHADSLYKEVGDWVDGGDVVAQVGASGGRSRPALHFELRVDGSPQDPLPWLTEANR